MNGQDVFARLKLIQLVADVKSFRHQRKFIQAVRVRYRVPLGFARNVTASDFGPIQVGDKRIAIPHVQDQLVKDINILNHEWVSQVGRRRLLEHVGLQVGHDTRVIN